MVRYLRFPLQPPHWPMMRHAGQAADARTFGATTDNRPSLILWINFVIGTSRVGGRNRTGEEADDRPSTIRRTLRVPGNTSLPVLRPYRMLAVLSGLVQTLATDPPGVMRCLKVGTGELEGLEVMTQ